MRTTVEVLKKMIRQVWNLPSLYKFRGFLFDLIDNHLTDHLIEKNRFRNRLGYELDLRNPKSFNQKVVWKKLNDRNPLLPVITDKLKVREYLKKVLGKEEAEKILIPVYFISNDPGKIPFEDLPQNYIIKTNHGCGGHVFVKKGKRIDRKQVVSQLRGQLARPYGLTKNEWAYWSIDRKVFVEKSLIDDESKAPKDYKFFMFHGRCYMVGVYYGRFSQPLKNLYDPDWNPIGEIGQKANFPEGPGVPEPENLELMLSYSTKLAEEFDFVRVDLYEVNGKVYFGELTNYPSSGSLKLAKWFDFELGSNWEVNPQYWVK